MGYYGYHQMIRKRIAAGELAGFAFVEDYPRIGKALVLIFSTMPHLRPVRPHRCGDYKDIWGGETDETDQGAGGAGAGADRHG